MSKKTFAAISMILWLSQLLGQQWGDYTLYSVSGSSNAYLIDTLGATFHTWTFPTSAKTGYSTYMLKGGTLVRAVQNTGNQLNGGGMTGRVQKVDWNGNVTWDFVYSSSTYCLHHDVCPMPNGNVLMISYDVRTAAEATQAGCSQNIIMWPDKIIEVQQTGPTTGTIVWEWKAWDHLVQNVNPAKSNYYPNIVDHPELLNINYKTAKDWMHMNGLDYNAELDQIAFSSHNLNEIYVIDHSTTTTEAASHAGGNSGKGGDILYRWGNPAAYNASGTAILNVVHDAHWIPADCPNAGYLVGFNNKGASQTQSAVDMINPPYNGFTYNHTAGQAFTPTSYTLRQLCNGSTSNMGNSQQLPNGNMLTCVAMSGLISEFNPSGTQIWSKQVQGSVSQAFRYTECYTTGLTPVVDIAPSATSICTGDNVQLNTNVSGGTTYTYSWYSSPTGFSSSAQSPNITPTANTTYSVVITSGGCKDTASTDIIVNPLPAAPTISQSGNALNASAGSSYSWFLGGNPVVGANTQSFTPAQSGSYQVQITDANGCTSPLSAAFEYVLNGIDDNMSESYLSIAPNPAQNYITLSGTMIEKPGFNVEVYDITGKLMMSGISSSTFSVKSLASGTYQVVVRNTAANATRKLFIIQ